MELKNRYTADLEEDLLLNHIDIDELVLRLHYSAESLYLKLESNQNISQIYLNNF